MAAGGCCLHQRSLDVGMLSMLDLDVTHRGGDKGNTKQHLLCLALWPTGICKTKEALRCSLWHHIQLHLGESPFIQPKAVIPASDADRTYVHTLIHHFAMGSSGVP